MDTYGISLEDYNAILAAQGGRCAICRGKRSGNLDTDHDHKLAAATGDVRASVRGLCCRRCNRRLLPAATDSVEVLQRAIDYLLSPPARSVLASAASAPAVLDASTHVDS